MALIHYGHTPCALCGEVLEEDQDIVATSHFIGDAKHPLFAYSDAAMHRACFLRWEHRAAFVATYNATGGGRMQADGTIREAFLSRVADAVIDKIVAFENRFRRRRG